MYNIGLIGYFENMICWHTRQQWNKFIEWYEHAGNIVDPGYRKYYSYMHLLLWEGKRPKWLGYT